MDHLPINRAYFTLQRHAAAACRPRIRWLVLRRWILFRCGTSVLADCFQAIGESFVIQGRYPVPIWLKFINVIHFLSRPGLRLIATPLGIQSQRAGKSGGFAVSVVLLLIYYIFITPGKVWVITENFRFF
jgi:hypothetical protein